MLLGRRSLKTKGMKMADKDWYTCPKHWVAWLKSDGENCPVCQLQAENKQLREALESVCSRCSHLENVVAALKETEDKYALLER